jgi:hypothetical protein
MLFHIVMHKDRKCAFTTVLTYIYIVPCTFSIFDYFKRIHIFFFGGGHVSTGTLKRFLNY